jgi:23S rRNA (cytidine1920-2'-O)/16S rRNA (cytidine1409-2'-O)-methyltransferase
MRLDVLLVSRGLYESREKARLAVMSGQVLVNSQKIFKPAAQVKPEADIKISGRSPYVSRGGLKLEKAIRCFNLNLKDKIVLDVGASTGGFTDCALVHGARLVYAVDVGYGQLAWSLRTDPRVVVMERTNIRRLNRDALIPAPDFAVIDVSFISLAIVLPVVAGLLTPDARGVALIKPQFEAGRGKVGKKGVVRDPLVHQEVIVKVCKVLDDLGLAVRGLDFSPLKGPEGNIEFLVYFAREGQALQTGQDNYMNRDELNWDEMQKKIFSVVEEAHNFASK